MRFSDCLDKLRLFKGLYCKHWRSARKERACDGGGTRQKEEVVEAPSGTAGATWLVPILGIWHSSPRYLSLWSWVCESLCVSFLESTHQLCQISDSSFYACKASFGAIDNNTITMHIWLVEDQKAEIRVLQRKQMERIKSAKIKSNRYNAYILRCIIEGFG